MVTRIVNPSGAAKITDDNGEFTPQFRQWINSINNQSLIIGTGNPEGIIEATAGSKYMDDIGVAGSVLYIKQKDSIINDKTKGWVLV